MIDQSELVHIKALMAKAMPEAETHVWVPSEGLRFIKISLAALVKNPAEVSVDDWPLPSSADRACINDAWRKLLFLMSEP